MNKEIWKPIKGYEGLYEVSNFGNVKSLPKYNKKAPVILRPTVSKRDGRMTVMLSRNPKDHKRLYVHRLVAMTFVKNPNGYKEVNHKDENPQNNNADNLEWCTRKYNMNYGTLPGRINDKNKRPLIAEDPDGNIIHFESVRDADRAGFTSRSIYYAMEDDRLFKGYKWRYA